jgi:UDP-N-acetylglucosamine 1-carboxyvinyltransferase
LEAEILVEGGHVLGGEISIDGAKNAALPILAATLLTSDDCLLENLPDIEDIRIMCKILESLGARVSRDGRGRLVVGGEQIRCPRAPTELATQIRGSFLVTGPLLGRFGEACAPHPGGCALGTRPVSVDVKGFQQMGAHLDQENGCYTFKTSRLEGTRIYLDYPSHTGTENLLMSACLARGRTVIENASVEPEVVDLANFLKAMGARISGAGTGIIQIEGVPRLHGTAFRVMPDRLAVGTYALAAAITGGSVALRGVISEHLGAFTAKLLEAGIGVIEDGELYRVKARESLKSLYIRTFPYPGFPTDLQAPFGALLTQAQGESTVHETMYDGRLSYVTELQRMGASIEVQGAHTATIRGPTPLKAANVRALDIRAGAAVLLAGLAAEGVTTVSDSQCVDRGYDRIDEKLACLGAKIWRHEGVCESSPMSRAIDL